MSNLYSTYYVIKCLNPLLVGIIGTFQLKEIIGEPKCVSFYRLDRHQIAGFSFHGNISFEPMKHENTCQWLLNKPQGNDPIFLTVDNKKWHFIKTIQRPGDKSDTVQIFQRIESNSND